METFFRCSHLHVKGFEGDYKDDPTPSLTWPLKSERYLLIKVPEYFTGDQNVSIFTIDDFPQEEDQTLLHVLRLMQ